VGGDKMDEAIANFIRRRHDVLIGDRTAEQIKIAIGNVFPRSGGDLEFVEVKGRDLLQGIPKSVIISESEVREALSEPVNQIVEVAKIALERCPPELAEDIIEHGISMVGGGALLPNLHKLISQRTGIRARVVEDPLSAVVVGSGAVLDQRDLLREVAVQ